MQYLRPRTAAYGLTMLIALAIAADLMWMPIQVADSLGEILDAQQSPSMWASFRNAVGTESYLRPVRIAQIKALFDGAQGEHYWLAYRGFHALLLVAALVLFTRALRVSTRIDFAAAAFALVVLVGLHTFRGTVQEAFPINHFLEIVVLCLLTLNLARSSGGVWIDLVAAATFIVAALTLESGLLVWVVAATAWAVGWRGISSRGLAALTVLAVAYVLARFVYLSTGVPALTERSTGYLFDVLDPPELQQRFGAHPVLFYAYNVIASALSVLFSEPQAGVFTATRAWLDDRVLPRVFLPVATSVITTGLLAWTAVRRASRSSLDDTSRLMLIFLAVLAANAAMSFAYTKNEIMSTAGAFYALAAFGGMRDWLLAVDRPGRIAVVSMLMLGVLSIGWSIRSAGVHYALRSQAIKHQIDWVDLPDEWRREGEWPADPAKQRLILKLRDEAVHLRVPNTRLDRPAWPSRLWNE
jgi:hypothetical protein